MDASSDMSQGMITRRRLMQASAATLAAAAWTPVGQVGPADAAAGAVPPAFPSRIRLYKQTFENWALEIRVDDVWTCAPATVAQVVEIANWGAAHGWQIRPKGRSHGWSPFTVLPGQTSAARMLLVDTSHLNRVVVDAAAHTVTAQAGALLDDILQDLENHGLGMSSIPAPGDITIAGAIAVGAHGAALPAHGEDTRGRSYGTLSNRICEIQIVAWNASTRRFGVRTVRRGEALAKALLTNLGRTFVTQVTLKAEQNVNLRCVSRLDIPATTLFQPTAGENSFMSFVEQAGRVEAIWFPFTPNPWLKTWSIAPTKPVASRQVASPYNYPFSDSIPVEVAELAKDIVSGRPEAAPLLGEASYATSQLGLLATMSHDLWGPAKNTQLYIRPSTLRAAEFGWGILTSRGNVQAALHDLTTTFSDMVAAYSAAGKYPINVAVELRCCGIDDPSFVGIPGAESPALSACSPRRDHPEWDTVIWANFLTLVGTPSAFPFRHELEQWIISHFVEPAATARVEWSKGWGFTNTAAWSNPAVVHHVIPDGFRVARTHAENWDWAVARLHELDPHRTFSNGFLNTLMG